MAIIVHKYGGTSMGSVERIKNVARRVAKWHRAGYQMVVVVSAMSGETNRLIALAKEIMPNPDPRELDVIASTGEQVSIGLLAMALKSIGVDAVSFNGSQVAVHTDSAFTKARIESIHIEPVKRELDAGKVVIVAGFQGRDSAGNVTTLGRGGSDYTASLIGAAVNASEIQIWTDIDGMHNNDPREVSGTRSVKHLSFNEAEQLAFYGAKILHPFCIAPARKRNIPVRLLSSMNPQAEGTLISDLQDDNIIKAIAAKDNIFYVKFESKHCLCPYQFISKIFDTFAKHRTPLCLLVSSNQDVSVAIDNSERLCKILAELEQYAKILMEDRMSIVSVVGNMRWQYAGVEAQIIEALADIPLRMISYGSNDSDVAFVIKTEDKKRALQALSNKLFEPETDKVTG